MNHCLTFQAKTAVVLMVLTVLQGCVNIPSVVLKPDPQNRLAYLGGNLKNGRYRVHPMGACSLSMEMFLNHARTVEAFSILYRYDSGQETMVTLFDKVTHMLPIAKNGYKVELFSTISGKTGNRRLKNLKEQFACPSRVTSVKGKTLFKLSKGLVLVIGSDEHCVVLGENAVAQVMENELPRRYVLAVFAISFR